MMRDRDFHLSDQELLLLADGELSPRCTARMHEHLTGCWACRARAAELEGAIADFVHLHQGRLDARLPRGGGLRSSLKARLAVAAAAGHGSHLRFFPNLFSCQIACACVALLIMAAGAWRMRTGLLHFSPVAHVQAQSLPDRSLTPGYTRRVKLSELCSTREPNAPPDEDASMEQRVFGEYGLPVSTSQLYELDYLIAPDLGGADDVRNLWPEPYASTAWNAHVKDQLEDRLHTMVCDGEIDLATAQRDIASNWIAAYKRYFHTEMPLPDAQGRTTRLEDRKRLALLAGRFSSWFLR